jgi:hypothetical protein
MDMRFNWLRDRAMAQEQFHIYWKHGPTNMGDYPTKSHPTRHHKEQRHIYVLNALQQTNKHITKTTQIVRNTCKGVLIANVPRQHGQHNPTVIKPGDYKLQRSFMG